MIYRRRMQRPFHWGPYPLEELPRRNTPDETRPASTKSREYVAAADGLAAIADKYAMIFAQQRDGEVAARPAPVPADAEQRLADIKGTAYFLDAAQVGIARLSPEIWLTDDYSSASAGEQHAIVIMVEHGRTPEPDNLAHAWVDGAQDAIARQRAAEIAVCVACHIRTMGFAARAHWPGASDVDLDRLTLLAGLGVMHDGRVVNPWLGENWMVSVVTTAYELPPDRPLAPRALKSAGGLRYWLGLSGAVSGRERNRRRKRPSHMSRYPMEQVKRVERPTTLILDDEVPRLPLRSAFFVRAAHGDLGAKAQREVTRFAYKQPLSLAMRRIIMSMVPHQDGPVAPTVSSRCDDAVRNARALKSLAYHFGADLAGICEVPRYAWYSHDRDGNTIQPAHRYALVMLIDQGYETMEGASGDDWISGAQSIRAYMRGGEIAGIMAEHIRSLGFPARSHTNADSQVLHIPLVLLAGLGELSRIGELVLNPFVGPRFKSVVLTTDMPLEVDQPIDFGLQYFCSHCLKCARECPCHAISFGDKVMFNGYEMWKPDVERCARYRVTNVGGAACGRCMKTCPLNKVVDADGPLPIRIASWLGVNAMWLKPLLVPIAAWADDQLGHGRRVMAQKWWLDLEVVDGVCVTPARTNRRDIDPRQKVDPAKHRIAYYPAAAMPAGDRKQALVVDRKAALAAADTLEPVATARRRGI